jgi:hypothetical protein
MKPRDAITAEYKKQKLELERLKNSPPPLFAQDAAKHAVDIAVQAAIVNTLSWVVT